MQANTGPGQNNPSQKPSLSWSQPAAGAVATPPKAVSAPATPSVKAAVTKKDETSYTGTYVGIFVAGIIVGALIGWAITGSHEGPAGSSASSTIEKTGTSTTSSVNLSGSAIGEAGSFAINSPQTAGFAVAVSNVQVSQPTWVVVYEDHAGIPGNALGAELFLPQSQGTAQDGTVQLLRGTLPGQNYLAGEALDDGDKIFSLQNDKPMRDVKGNPILVQFSTQ